VALWEHGPIPAALLRTPWARRRVRRGFESAAVLYAWSGPAAASISELCGREAIRLEHGVDAEAARRATAMRRDVRIRLGIAQDAPLLAFVGRLVEDKGVIAAVEALGAMPEAHLVICGEGLRPRGREKRRRAWRRRSGCKCSAMSTGPWRCSPRPMSASSSPAAAERAPARRDRVPRGRDARARNRCLAGHAGTRPARRRESDRRA
jgi:hypothetical protein